ncbi:MAG: fructose-6-phosphate aldolase [Candidatus Jidaibacter sp.]|nr:fructose-6-phosphate aldolase [Candidatus Jidaibacter sp.]
MQLYLDSGKISEIEELASLGIIDGVTTNPSLVKDGASNLVNFVKEICKIIKTSVSVEVIASSYVDMMREAEKLYKIEPQVVIKLPMTLDGIKACKKLSSQMVKTNITLCFSPAQAILAAKAGATYVSPFIGRLDDIGQDGMVLIDEIRRIYDNYPDLNTKILSASIRSVNHIVNAAKVGSDIATAPYTIIKQMISHPLTDVGISKFVTDAQKSGYKI